LAGRIASHPLRTRRVRVTEWGSDGGRECVKRGEEGLERAEWEETVCRDANQASRALGQAT